MKSQYAEMEIKLNGLETLQLEIKPKEAADGRGNR